MRNAPKEIIIKKIKNFIKITSFEGQNHAII